MSAYYNEFDPFAAEWLRELIKAGHIAPGVVDERSIEDVVPNELIGFTQCHFFAGIGGWSLALRLAGWPDDKPVWTGSCPCQPFSAAGKSLGFADERHLWPVWFHLISECHPVIVFGEQVASKATGPWFDLVQADLEVVGYAFGCVPFPAASVGAPHIRDRAYWVADSQSSRSGAGLRNSGPPRQRRIITADGCSSEWMADPISQGPQDESTSGPSERGAVGRTGASCGLADTDNTRRQLQPNAKPAGIRGEEVATCEQMQQPCADGTSFCGELPGPTNGQWRDADWLLCRDGKWRPVVASHVGVVDGLPDELVRGGGQGDEENQEKINGETGEENGPEVLQILQCGNGTQEKAQRRPGGLRIIRPESLLRPKLHGKGDGEGAMLGQELQQNESAPECEGIMRTVRKNRTPSCPPQRRGPFQQRHTELDYVVSSMPQQMALAKLHGRQRDQEALQTLCEAICKKGSVQFSPVAAQEVWESFSSEDKDGIGLGTGYEWVTRSFSPLSVGESNRVGLLRGYGNSIVPAQAAEFISAVIDSLNLKK